MTHHNRTSYVLGECREACCRAANTMYETRRRCDVILGRPRRIDATGTRRRLQALIAAGWPQRRLTEALGWYPTHFRRILFDARQVRPATAAEVRAAYDRLWTGPPPPTTSRGATDIARAKALAAGRGWPPPMAWDDEQLDDPTATPTPTEPPPRPGCKLPDRDGLLELRERGWNNREIAERYGATVHGVSRAINGGRPAHRARKATTQGAIA